MVAKSAAFEKAVTDSRNLKAKPTTDELLEVSLILYSPLVFSFMICHSHSNSESESESNSRKKVRNGVILLICRPWES